MVYLNTNFKKNSNNVIFTTIFATFYFEITINWSKSRILKNHQLEHAKTPSKMHMYDMVKIDAIVFEIVGGGLLKTLLPPGSSTVWNIPDRIGLSRKVKNPIPETMAINGQDCSDKGTIAESFNTFFTSIGKRNEYFSKQSQDCKSHLHH